MRGSLEEIEKISGGLKGMAKGNDATHIHSSLRSSRFFPFVILKV